MTTKGEVKLKSFDIELRWTPVRGAEGESYRFPSPISKYLQQNFSGPAIYCWRVDRPNLPPTVYLGETENMAKRMVSVLAPRRLAKYDLHLRKFLRDAVKSADATVVVEVLSFPTFTCNGFPVSVEMLVNPFVRKFMESVVILSELQAGSVLLNRGKNLLDKMKEQLVPIIEKLDPKDQEKFYKYMAARAGKF